MIDAQILQGILSFVIAYFCFTERTPDDHWLMTLVLQVTGLCMIGLGVGEILVAFRVGL